MKSKTLYICQECGYESSGWLGKCPACMKWNTFVEEKQNKVPSAALSKRVTEIININDVNTENEDRYLTGIGELDRVLGGGLVRGSLVLFGGDPGIGKSTLLLQVCDKVACERSLIYISGEESVKQIKIRADRLLMKNQNILMASETNLQNIEDIIENKNPSIVIIDSIQTVYDEELSAAPGSVSQVRAATARLMRIAKDKSITMLIVGHVTKEGAIAGPRVLEHMVDTVLYFEGDRHLSYRVLRSVKNRFGSTNEIGMFEMRDTGLSEIANPSEILLSERPEDVPGSVVISGVEGTRPMLIEVQALVCPTSFGMPRRMATGLDYNRIILLMAVLEKIVGMQLSNYDAYVNVVGGLKLTEPACDLGVIIAIASSFKSIPVGHNTIFLGEVGLTGEVRAVSQVDKRVMEAVRSGYKKCVIPSGNEKYLKQMKFTGDVEIVGVKNINEALQHLNQKFA